MDGVPIVWRPMDRAFGAEKQTLPARRLFPQALTKSAQALPERYKQIR
jgi:hypothetical protein